MYAYPGEAFIAWEALVTPPGSGAATSGLGEGGQKAQRPEEATSGGERVGRAPWCLQPASAEQAESPKHPSSLERYTHTHTQERTSVLPIWAWLAMLTALCCGKGQSPVKICLCL